VDATLGSNCLQGSKNITNSELVGAQVIVVERFSGESFSNVGWVATEFEEGSYSAVKLGDEDLAHPRVFADVLDEPLIDFAFVEKTTHFLEVINKEGIGNEGTFWKVCPEAQVEDHRSDGVFDMVVADDIAMNVERKAFGGFATRLISVGKKGFLLAGASLVDHGHTFWGGGIDGKENTEEDFAFAQFGCLPVGFAKICILER